jgi:hypothetical protein
MTHTTDPKKIFYLLPLMSSGRQARGTETNNKMQKRKRRETWV